MMIRGEVFFFSSRRRHTRLQGDWSSDVCSSDLYELPLLDWADVRRTLETQLTQAPETGGPDHHTFWLSTLDADGRPHMTAVGAFWVAGRYYFTGGPRSRKIRNIERDSRCAFGVG